MIRTGQSRDQKRYEALMTIGCVACHIDGRYSQGDVHHVVTNGYRRLSGGNASTLILCPWHHRAYIPDNHTVTWMRNIYGPSMALESKAFAERYGSQRELLAKANEMLSTGKSDPVPGPAFEQGPCATCGTSSAPKTSGKPT